ncbi:MAG: ABC transporter permease [Clostridia bacterium]|nr:ABC transporter permease [Clostridia bacterium]
MKALSRAFMILIFGILYVPMMILVLFSFNKDNSTGSFGGFSLRWYGELFSNADAFVALRNTLILAVCSAALATVIGTLAAVGMHKMKNKYVKGAVNSLTNVPMMNPEIVTGISMMLLFVFVGGMLHLTNSLSFWTMLIAHTTFNLPYVILSVMPKLRQMDKHLPEAAMDLGCTQLQAFFKVELHQILPGIITGAMMAFTMSLDDFVISLFTSGIDFQTLPIYIYTMTKKKVTPDVYALFTLMMAIIFLLMLLIQLRRSGESSKEKNGGKG